MDYVVLPVDTDVKSKPGGKVYLVEDNWNDWWEYRVLYQLYFKDEADDLIYIGSVKIGEIGMEEGQDRVNIPKEFESLSEKFFSLGQDSYYYENLNRISDQFRDDLLRCLNDVALNLNLFEKVSKLPVTETALLRSIRPSRIRKEFHSLACGNSALSEYNFKFKFPKTGEETTIFELLFQSIPDSNPPTNVHAIIGRNGVGKTHLLNRMVTALIGSNIETNETGLFESVMSLSREEKLFNNIIYLSFSAFDDAKFFNQKKIKKNGIGYSYIGLKYRRLEGSKKNNNINISDDIQTKSTEQLRYELIDSIWKCRVIPSKKARLEEAIQLLNTDPIFTISEVSDLLLQTDEEANYYFKALNDKRNLTNEETKYLKSQFQERAIPICKKFSSGHSIVLLTITKLIEELEEKTLVLLDEPESHLHPPLLATFTRILSALLVRRNGIGIIATHSPVILQEIPRKCIWMLNRFGREIAIERPNIETFGENINSLTKEVFSFEITNSGFHKLLHDISNIVETYEEGLEYFNNELGMEARAILRSIMQLKEN